jgi:uncharacterized protein (TIGR03435 family)
VYELTVLKKGPKLREFVESAPAPPDGKWSTTEKDGFVRIRPGPPVAFGDGHIRGGGQTVSELVSYFSSELNAPVVEKTGLTGKYDYNLEFARSPSVAAANLADAPPDFVTAVRDQLGLKLESKKGPVDLLVIDHMEKTPTAN